MNNDDITILCCIDRLISMNRFEIFGLNDEQENFFANYDEVYNSITHVRNELCVLNSQLKKLKEKITKRSNYELDERESKQCSDGIT